MIVTVDLTRREMDELLRCEMTSHRGHSRETRDVIARELESAQLKIRTAIDEATRRPR